MREKVGRGEDQGGIRDGRGVDPERKMEEGASEGESPNRKDGFAMRKGECGVKRVGRSLEKSPEIGFETGKGKKKWATQGKKRARSLEKSPGIGFETGKSGKNGDFGAKKEGWGSGGKMGFTADFAML